MHGYLCRGCPGDVCLRVSAWWVYTPYGQLECIIVFSNILSLWTNNVTSFSKISGIMSPLDCYFRFSISVLENLKSKKK